MEFSLKDFGEIIKKSWLMILVVTVAGTALGYGISAFLVQKEYQATAMMIVSSTTQNKDTNVNTMTVDDYDLNARLVASYSVLCKSERVLSQVRDRLGIQMDLDKLSDEITVSSKENTDIISLSVTDASPQTAQSIANTLVDVFKNEVTVIMKMDNVQVIDYASAQNKPFSPNVMIDTVIGGLVGLITALIIAILRFTLDDTVKESNFITDIMDVPVIGNVPKFS